MKIIVLLFACCLCLGTTAGFAQDNALEKKALAVKPPTSQENAPAPADDGKREPFKITREFESQMEEVEPPEIEVTGIFRAKGKTVAMAKLQLDKVEGRVALKPGMRVSIPKPDRESSESEHWMTYFTVRKIDSSGMIIVLENGETVWYPVMGKLD
ncbi:MAG: hypothetical protein CR984_03485 [Proteobacteria bacterium]|nr:MAG: hypothetical protein CR984_03485 [Pseudomonadota bacterium]